MMMIIKIIAKVTIFKFTILDEIPLVNLKRMSSIDWLDELFDLTNFDATLRIICEVDCAVPYKNPSDIITDR
jgi:hypothetical protein